MQVVGDNLPVLRMAATNGRVRTPGIWELLEAPVTHAALQEWNCRWVAVRRKFNSAADKLATVGTLEADQMAARNEWTHTIALWTEEPLRTPPSSLAWHNQWTVRTVANPLVDLTPSDPTDTAA